MRKDGRFCVHPTNVGTQNLQCWIPGAPGSRPAQTVHWAMAMRDGLEKFEQRTKQFAIDAIKLCGRLEEVRGLRQLSWQLADSSGSVAANHRAMRRARSDKEFAAKLQIVNEEIDESVLWLEIAEAVLITRDAAANCIEKALS